MFPLQKAASFKPGGFVIMLGAFVLLFSSFNLHAAGDSLAKMPDDTLKVNAFFKLAMQLRQKDSAAAATYANQMLLLSEKLKFVKGQASAYYVLGRIAHEHDSHEQAIELLKKGIGLYEKEGDQTGIMYCYYWVARCYRRIADYPNYQKYLAMLEEQAIKLNNKEYLSYAFDGYGNLYRYVGDYPQSINYYMKSIELSEALGKLEDVSGSLNNMSLVYDYQGKPLEELKIQRRNYEILQKLGKKSKIVLCLSNLSGIYKNLGLKKEANEYILKAIHIIAEVGPDNIPFKDVAAAYGQFASMAVDNGDYDKGLEYYNKDLELRQTHKDVKGISDSYGRLAYVYMLTGKVSLANEYLLKQLAIATGIGYVNGRIQACKSLAELEEKKGDYKTAYKYRKEYTFIKDSMETSSNSEQLARIDNWFKIKDQQKQIELLSKDKAIKELELKKRKIISNVLGGGLILIMIFTILILESYRKLKRAKSQLLSVNQELESFSYSVSHDLRTPLRAVDIYAGMLGEDHITFLNEEGKKLVASIQLNVKKMGQMIYDLLAFSRLGKKEIAKTKVNMKELTENVLNELNILSENRATIKLGELHSAKGDYSLLSQVVINLVSNALKYSAKTSEPLIEISSKKTGNEVIYTIKDNGVGFDMNFSKKLFGVFQRLHSSQEFEGTGVGLAIVKRIINKHGGRVWAEGEKNKGATFRFSLPLN